ncbi:MFS transporter [Streptomyces sp. NPDC050121]|uniref:MFS transporter n=1 Tax=Streptomyces sp. NPDC050121 TaxID=3365601 RepID=UPI0037BDB494
MPSLSQQRVALTSNFLTLGFVLGVWAVSIPSIKDRMPLSYGQVGLTLLVLGLSSLSAMSVSGRLMSHFGERRILICGGAAFGLSALGPAAAGTWPELLAAAVVLGACSGTFDASQNALAVALERKIGRPVIISFHAWFSAGGLLAALLGSVVLQAGIDVRWLLVGTAAAAATLSLCLAPWLPAAPRPARTEDEPAGQPALRNRRIIVLGLVAFALFTAEGAAYDWSNLYLRNVIGAAPNVATLAFGAFSVGMISVRVIADRVVAHVGPDKYCRAATILAAAGLGLAVLSNNAPMAILGWTLAGLGIAGTVPLTFSVAGNVDPRHSSTYVSRVAAFGYCGLLAGPSLIGFIAQVTTLRIALIVPVVCCLLVAGAAGIFKARPARPTARRPARSGRP